MIKTLVVDDEPALLELSRMFLENTKEICVDVAGSAYAALDCISSSSYDVIVSDYDMPGMDGILLLKKIRSEGGKIPFILFTGKGREEIVIEALNSGATFYLQKGADTKAQYAELVSKIQMADRQYRAEQSVQDSHRQMESILSFLPDPTIVIDRSGKLIVWNHAAEELTGIPASDLLGKGDYSYAVPFYGKPRPILADLIIHPDERFMSTCYHMREITPRFLIGECEVDLPGGKHLVLWVKATPLYGAKGEVSGAIEIFRDITDRVKIISEHRAARETLARKNEEILSRNEQLAAIEEELRQTLDELQQSHWRIQESERKHRVLIDSLPDALLIHEHGMIVYANPAACTLFGMDKSQLSGKAIAGLLGSGTDDALPAVSGETGEGKNITGSREIPVKKSDGQIAWLETTVSPIDDDGKTRIQVLFHDISGRKRSEEQAAGQHDEVERYAKALKRANRNLNLLYAITRHDILNQLTVLSGFMELARALVTDPVALDYLKKQKCAARAIYQNILFTRDYQALGIHEPVWQNLQDLVSCVTAQVSAPGIRFTITLAELEIYADPLLEKIFYNLIDNSLRHGQRVNEIKMYVLQNEHGVILVYEDNGVGVPGDEKRRIFERGYGKNTGLGLYLVQEILSLTDIGIRETGEPDHGARFEIQIPALSFRLTRTQIALGKDRPPVNPAPP